jgi:hypothetical protein
MADFFNSPAKSKKRKGLSLSLPAKRAPSQVRIPLSDMRTGDYNVSSAPESAHYLVAEQHAQKEQDKENTAPVKCTRLRFKLNFPSTDNMLSVIRSEAPAQPDSKCQQGEH